MIRFIIILISFTLSFVVYTQTFLEGKYLGKFPTAMHGEYYIFDKNGTFEYYEWGDILPDNYGRGKYEIKDTVLILNFEDIPEMHDTLIYFDDEFLMDGDTIKYDIQLFDYKTKLPIQYGAVKLRYNNNIIDKSRKSTFLIQDFIAENVYFTKNNLPTFIVFQSLSGGSLNYEITDSLSRKMRIYIKDLHIARNYIEPKQEKIRIRNINKGNFELFKYKDWFSYKKKSFFK